MNELYVKVFRHVTGKSNKLIMNNITLNADNLWRQLSIAIIDSKG